ncbi:MAG: hypothetical protein SNG69_08960 [Rikenellaceae bacterium]
MAKKVYRVKTEYQSAVVRTIKPSWRADGLFVLAKCSQRDLKYLFSVINHQAVEIDEQETESESETAVATQE